MNKTYLTKYADLISRYCLNIKEGDRVFIRSTYLAEPFLLALQESLLKKGAYPEFQVEFKGQLDGFYASAPDAVLDQVGQIDKLRVEAYNKLISIDAPFDKDELKTVSAARISRRKQAFREIKKQSMKRGASGELTWVLCNYPTQAFADIAGLTYEEYEKVVVQACFLDQPDPVQSWKNLGKEQQRIVDVLNQCESVEYKGPNIDVTFSTKGRRWINSDGKRNMPSGEVFTSPVEESVEGRVKFTYPISYMGREIQGVSFDIKQGEIVHATADSGDELLQSLLQIPGAKMFGEVAIGNNPNISAFTKDILFDEKLAGTVHMAIGASYPETGGLNESSLHLDLITDMKKESEIVADGKVIYRNGLFLI